MANPQEIDRLLLEIDVEDKTEGSSEKLVEGIATAVSKLNAEIAKLDIGKIDKVTKALSAFGSGSVSKGGTSTTTKAINAESKAIKDLIKQREKLEKEKKETLSADWGDEYRKQVEQQYDSQIANIDAQIEQARSQQTNVPQLAESVNKAGENVRKLNSLTDIQRYKLADIQKQLADNNITEEEYVKLKEQELRLEKQIKGNSKNSLISSIKRVAVYRAIRALLKMVTNAFKEGINNVALYSESVNNALSSIKSSGTIISNSIGVMLAPLLESIAPIIQYLAVGFGDLANSISYLNAQMRGQTTYLKVNTEYFKKLNEQSRLLSFDNFEKIQGGNNVSDMFGDGKVADGLPKVSDELKTVAFLIGVIGIGLAFIEGIKLVTNFANGSILKGITKIGKALKESMGTIGWLAIGISLLVVGIADMIASWNNANFESWEKVITIVTASFVGLATAIIATVMAIKGIQGVGAMVGFGLALTGAVLIAGTELSKLTKPKNYAFGGGYNTADLFYANENGQTELIASTNSGGGAVMNMQQLEGAIFNGMTRAMSTGSGESAVYLDGERVGKFVASSSGFRNEANRRNTSLNWR